MSAGFLRYARYRYLWVALALSLLSLGLYFSQDAQGAQPPNGGTWQGYVLGTLGALLIVWLSLLGVRKRRYRVGRSSVQAWTSAHSYLGASLIVVATLHCALQFGMNVHTLAYLLLVIVVLSGIFGAWVYTVLPARRAANAEGRDIAHAAIELEDLDSEIRELAVGCEATLRGVVDSALELTHSAGGYIDRLLGRDRSQLRLADGSLEANRDQRSVISALARRVPNASRRREAEAVGRLLDAFGRRQVLLRRLRRDARLEATLRSWLYLHVPVTAALLAALFVHIVSVFIYW